MALGKIRARKDKYVVSRKHPEIAGFNSSLPRDLHHPYFGDNRS